MRVSAILLAAGRSSRMGCQKGLLPWHGKTLFEHQIQELKNANLSEIIVVTGHDAIIYSRMAKHFPIISIYNHNYLEGKCSSIVAGLLSVDKQTEMVLIVAVDQPTDAKIILQLIETLQKGTAVIAVPLYDGKRGHPLLFSTTIMDDLLAIKEETKGLRHLFQKYDNQVIEVPIGNSLIHLNINTPEDYQKALKHYQYK